MAYLAASLSDAGRIRSRNEDASLLLQWEMAGAGAQVPVLLAAVADGMGGHEGGHLASALALRTLAAATLQRLCALPAGGPVGEAQLIAALREAIAAAAANVNAACARRGPMGCTLAAALLWGRRLLVANVGDSRVYLVHQQLQQLTVDHSLVARLVAQGEISAEEARVHPRRHEIYRMIGFGRAAQPDFYAVDLVAGDAVLLCSDGLYTMVPEADLYAVFRRPGLSDAERCRLLVAMANDAGGEDNITAVLIRVDATVSGGVRARGVTA